MAILISALQPLQVIGLSLSGIILTCLSLYFLLKDGGEKAFKASDGTRFSSEEACFRYDEVLKQLNLIYEHNGKEPLFIDGEKLQTSFLELLTKKGFPNVKTLIQYRKGLKTLADVLNKVDSD